MVSERCSVNTWLSIGIKVNYTFPRYLHHILNMYIHKMGGSINGGSLLNGQFLMENPTKMGTPIHGDPHSWRPPYIVIHLLIAPPFSIPQHLSGNHTKGACFANSCDDSDKKTGISQEAHETVMEGQEMTCWNTRHTRIYIYTYDQCTYVNIVASVHICNFTYAQMICIYKVYIYYMYFNTLLDHPMECLI